MKPTILIFLALFLLIPLATAVDTEIVVKTLPGRTVFINVLKPVDQYEPIIIDKSLADYKGEATYVFSDSAYPEFKVLAVVKWMENTEFREEFGPFNAGDEVYLELLPEDYVDPLEGQETETPVAEVPLAANVTNQTEEVNTTITPPVNGNNSITGNVVSTDGEKSKFLQIALYAIGALALLAIIVFGTAGIMKSKKKYSPPAFKPVKLAPRTDQPYSQDPDSELGKIERKMRDVDRQIAELKDGDRIKQAERKLEEKMRYLDQLKKQREQGRDGSNFSMK